MFNKYTFQCPLLKNFEDKALNEQLENLVKHVMNQLSANGNGAGEKRLLGIVCILYTWHLCGGCQGDRC